MKGKGLAIGIIILLIVVNTNLTFARDVVVEPISPIVFDGNTLYVGGSGPNNYSTIQSAIDNASDGDTVFVYDDSSPYNENIEIDKSINLIGEDRNSTIIDSDDSVTISIQSDWVSVSGFKIKGKSYGIKGSGYVVISDNNFESDTAIECIGGDENTISNNIINSSSWGIRIELSDNNTVIGNTINTHSMGGIRVVSYDNIISDNIIMNTRELVYFPADIEIFLGDGNIISNNTLIAMDDDTRIGINIRENIKDNIVENNTIIGYDGAGIELADGENNRIYRNNIDNCRDGIYVESSRKNIVNFNEISNCIEGISLSRSNFNTIENNNFLNNDKHATFYVLSISNIWDGNYWDGPQDSPYIIVGRLFLFFIPWINFDWNPAQEPYDIGG